MSKMVDNAIRDLEIHKKDITALVLIGDAEDFQIVKVGLNGATHAQMLGLVATLEMVKLDLINTLKTGEGFVEDCDEVPEEFQEDDDDDGTKFH